MPRSSRLSCFSISSRRLGRERLALELLPVLLDLLGDVVGDAELLLDRLELLPEEVLALALVDLAPRHPRDLLLDGQDADLAPEDLEDRLQPVDARERLEDLLRLVELQVEVRGGEVGEAGRVVEARGDEHHLGRDRLARGPTAFSRPSFTARRSASTSSVAGCAGSGSGILTALARSDGLSWT